MLVTLSRLGALLADVAEPLLGTPPEKKHVDRSMKEAEGQAALDGQTSPPPARVEIAAMVSTGQVVRMDAVPPVQWDAGAKAWTCAADTELVVALVDGSRKRFHYRHGTAIPVAVGMIHFPRCNQDEEDESDDT